MLLKPLFQFKRFYTLHKFESNIRSVTFFPLQPKDINVAISGNRLEISGEYGEDLFTNHSLTVKIDGVDSVFSSFDDIPNQIDEIVHLQLDPTFDMLFTIEVQLEDGNKELHIQQVIHDQYPLFPLISKLSERINTGE